MPTAMMSLTLSDAILLVTWSGSFLLVGVVLGWIAHRVARTTARRSGSEPALREQLHEQVDERRRAVWVVHITNNSGHRHLIARTLDGALVALRQALAGDPPELQDGADGAPLLIRALAEGDLAYQDEDGTIYGGLYYEIQEHDLLD